MQDVVIFIRANGSLLKIDNGPLALMKKYRQLKQHDKEAGGILLGRMIENSNDVIIDEVTEPGPKDKRSKFSFFRSKSIQKIINLRWLKSNNTRNYLGEWHTHPESYPSPSTIDIIDWKNIMKKGVFYQDFLFFIIVGQVKISAWEFRKGDIAPRKLNDLE